MDLQGVALPTGNPNRNQTEDFRSSLVPIHWLHTQAYGECQIYLEKVLGLETEPTAEMVASSEKHAILDKEHEERAELELTVNEALLCTRQRCPWEK